MQTCLIVDIWKDRMNVIHKIIAELQMNYRKCRKKAN